MAGAGGNDNDDEDFGPPPLILGGRATGVSPDDPEVLRNNTFTIISRILDINPPVRDSFSTDSGSTHDESSKDSYIDHESIPEEIFKKLKTDIANNAQYRANPSAENLRNFLIDWFLNIQSVDFATDSNDQERRIVSYNMPINGIPVAFNSQNVQSIITAIKDLKPPYNGLTLNGALRIVQVDIEEQYKNSGGKTKFLA